MKNIIIVFVSLLAILLPAISQAKFPNRLCSFALGDDISNYENRLDRNSLSLSNYYDYIVELDIMPMEGLKSGSIQLGKCDAVNKIVSIKLKFEEKSKSFFKKLLRQYEKNFGPPDEYKGDVFQSVIAWKWSFKNDAGDRISLTIQHNKMVQEEKLGNSVKLSLTSQIDREKECYLEKQSKKTKPAPMKVKPGKDFWDLYTPK